MASKVSSPTTTGSGAQQQQQQQQAASILRRSWSSATSPTCAQGGHTQMCVCAPPTHAGSFKCRLHRSTSTNSHHPGQSTVAQQASAAARTSTSSSNRTVEAQ